MGVMRPEKSPPYVVDHLHPASPIKGEGEKGARHLHFTLEIEIYLP